MFKLLKIVLALLAVTGIATVGFVYYDGGLSPLDWVYHGGSPSNWTSGGVHGAPGPIAGAGVPLVAAAYGVYRLFKRVRKAD